MDEARRRGNGRRLLLVSAIRLHREGLRGIICERADFRIVGETSQPVEAQRMLGLLRPDVVLLDLPSLCHIPGLRQLRAWPATIVALGLPEREEEVILAAEAGVTAFLTPDAGADELVDTLASARPGEFRCTPRVAGVLQRRVALLAGTPEHDLPRLTHRESEVMALVEHGLSNREIAERLCIELSTVKNHLRHAFDKLNVHRRSDAATALHAISEY